MDRSRAPQPPGTFVHYDKYSRKMLVGSKTIVGFINAHLMESPLSYMTYLRTYRPRLRQAGVVRRDRITRRDVAVPYLLAKYWEEELLEPPAKTSGDL